MNSYDTMPAVPLPRPVSAMLSPQSVAGGQYTLYTVALSIVTGHNQTVQISTDHPEVFANLPTSLVVLAGTLGQSTTLQSKHVPGTVYATITALCNGVTLPCTLTVSP